MGKVLRVKLCCQTWQQLRTVYERDIKRKGFFLKSSKPPPLGTPIRIQLTLPSDTSIVIDGVVGRHVAAGELGGRGVGLDLNLKELPQTAIWLIESSLNSKLTEEQRAQPTDSQPKPEGDLLSTQAGGELAVAESDLIGALWTELSSLGGQPPHKVLSCAEDASGTEIRRAFGQLTKRYHPDRFTRYESDEISHLASEVFLLIRDAYAALSSNVEEKENAPKEGNASKQVKPQVQQGKASPAPAVDAAPSGKSPKVISETPEASALIDQGSLEEALTLLQEQSKLHPTDKKIRALIELAQGLRAMQQGDKMDAAERFELVLELDPDNPRAALEVSKMRQSSIDQRKKLLSKLMEKKA